jgi:hypothetical protein
MPPKVKNKANTKIRRSGRSDPDAAKTALSAGTGSVEEAVAISSVTVGFLCG